MEHLLYLAKVGIIYSLLYLIYFFLFRNSTHFQTNRIYLLLIVPLSFILPHLNNSIELIQQYQVTLPIFETSGFLIKSNSFDWSNTILFGYLTIASLLLVKFLFNLFKIIHTIVKIKNVTLTEISPFSFFSFIYVSDHINTEDRAAIILHEKVHAEHLHSLDILVYEICKVILWWNPFIWMGSTSVKNNHEFIADQLASKKNDQYSSVLVAQLLGVNCSVLANNFKSNLLIKKRMMMMKTKKSTPLSVIKYAVAIPVIAASIMMTNNDAVIAKTYQKTAYLMEKESHLKSIKNLGEVDQMPEFKGGKTALMNYLGENIRYPKEAQKDNAEGTVFVSFTIDKKGNVSNSKVVRSIHPLLDNEALSVIKGMPKWTPGKHDGKNVSVEMKLPIKFTLQK